MSLFILIGSQMSIICNSLRIYFIKTTFPLRLNVSFTRDPFQRNIKITSTITVFCTYAFNNKIFLTNIVIGGFV